MHSCFLLRTSAPPPPRPSHTIHLSGGFTATHSGRPRHTHVHAANDDEQPSSSGGSSSQLSVTLRRRKNEIDALLKRLGTAEVERLLALPPTRTRGFELSALIARVNATQRRPVIVIEIGRSRLAKSPAQLAELARKYVAWGADALAVPVDAEDSPEGLEDLRAVAAAARVPVLAVDWAMHPIQVVEARDRGAVGLIGTIAQVLNKGAVILSSYAAAQGLDAPVEVVNLAEVEAMSQGRAPVPFYGFLLNIRITLAVPGFRESMLKNMMDSLPAGALSIVGVRSAAEAREARALGAHAVLVKRATFGEDDGEAEVERAVRDLRLALSGPVWGAVSEAEGALEREDIDPDDRVV